MNSILQTQKKCYMCENLNVEEHHIYFGTGLRAISEKYGFKVWLCAYHHRGTNGVHGKNGNEFNRYLKQCCQLEFEKTHTREKFIEIIGRNYL